jgi:DNA-binding transcriptional MerR regulator
MLTVNQLAKRANAPAHVVRYYTRIGLLQPAAQGDNGYRLYRASDASRLRFIRHAKQLGFTLKEIGEITRHAERGESPCADVRCIIQRRIDENRRKIEAMQRLQQRMEQALAQWRTMPDGEPDGTSICHLIESFDSDSEGPQH